MVPVASYSLPQTAILSTQIGRALSTLSNVVHSTRDAEARVGGVSDDD